MVSLRTHLDRDRKVPLARQNICRCEQSCLTNEGSGRSDETPTAVLEPVTELNVPEAWQDVLATAERSLPLVRLD